jgi:GNAT superfamily N-acetyltransferase
VTALKRWWRVYRAFLSTQNEGQPLRFDIREATGDDAEDLAKLADQLGYPARPEQMLNRLGRVDRATGRVLVAVPAGKVVGWIHVVLYHTLVTDHAAQLLGLVVDKNWRGRAVGRALLGAAEAWALEESCDVMYVRSRITRVDAHAFYKHLGYQELKTSLTFVKTLQRQSE